MLELITKIRPKKMQELTKISTYLQKNFPKSEIIIFTDQKIKRLYGDTLTRFLNKNDIPTKITTNPDEDFTDKILISLGGESIREQIQNNPSTKKLHIPTTLYSMINSDPELTIINFTKTLPKKQIKNALAYCIKYAILENQPQLDFIDENFDNIMKFDLPIIQKITKEAITSKQSTTINSPQNLNYANEFQNLIQSQNPNLLHGYALSLAISLTNKIAVKRGLLASPIHKKIKNLLQKIGLPIVALKTPKVDPDTLLIPFNR